MKRDMKAEKKVIDFLLDHAGEKKYLSEIARSSRVNTPTCYQILERKVAEGLVEKVKFGNLSIYFLDSSDSLVSQLKVARAVELIKPLIEKLKDVSQRIILFGSAARGEDTAGSDFDLFILTNDKNEVKKILRKSKIGRKIQPVVKNFLEFSELKRKDEIFSDEINKGKVLWEEEYGE